MFIFFGVIQPVCLVFLFCELDTLFPLLSSLFYHPSTLRIHCVPFGSMNLAVFIICLNIVFIHLKAEQKREKLRAADFICWFTSQAFSTARSQPGACSSIKGLPCGWLGPKPLELHLLRSGCVTRMLDEKHSSQDLNQHLVLSDGLTCWATMPTHRTSWS